MWNDTPAVAFALSSLRTRAQRRRSPIHKPLSPEHRERLRRITAEGMAAAEKWSMQRRMLDLLGSSSDPFAGYKFRLAQLKASAGGR